MSMSWRDYVALKTEIRSYIFYYSQNESRIDEIYSLVRNYKIWVASSTRVPALLLEGITYIWHGRLYLYLRTFSFKVIQ